MGTQVRRYAADQLYLAFTIQASTLVTVPDDEAQVESVLTGTAWDGDLTGVRPQRDLLARLLASDGTNSVM